MLFKEQAEAAFPRRLKFKNEEELAKWGWEWKHPFQAGTERWDQIGMFRDWKVVTEMWQVKEKKLDEIHGRKGP